MQLRDNLIFGCISAVLALTLAVTDSSAQNLLVNPGFETGDLTDWQVVGEVASATVTVQSPDNGPSAPGTHHVFLDNQTTSHHLTLRQSTAAGTFVPGVLDFSFDLKSVQLEAGAVWDVQLQIEQAGGGVIETIDFGYYHAQDWQTTTNTFPYDGPPNADFVTVQFTMITFGQSGSVSSMLLDNVRLEIEPTVPVESINWGRIKAQYR